MFLKDRLQTSMCEHLLPYLLGHLMDNGMCSILIATNLSRFFAQSCVDLETVRNDKDRHRAVKLFIGVFEFMMNETIRSTK